MPSRNTVKEYDVNSYYHVYNRGVEKRVIFEDNEDYTVFLNLLKRHLGSEVSYDSSGREYERLDEEMSLVAFCLMPNHFHLLIYQVEADAMTRLMRKVCTAYSSYFNRKYKRVGRLFQGTYKASRIRDEGYLAHITRYIHLNPEDYLGWEWSSLPAYLGYRQYEWLHPEQVLDSQSQKQYLQFIEDYRDHRVMLKKIQAELADD